MLLYEINKKYIREMGLEKAIERELYIVRDDNFVKHAFSLGRGTKNDMNRYMRDNKCFCVWIDAETKKEVTRI